MERRGPSSGPRQKSGQGCQTYWMNSPVMTLAIFWSTFQAPGFLKTRPKRLGCGSCCAFFAEEVVDLVFSRREDEAGHLVAGGGDVHTGVGSNLGDLLVRSSPCSVCLCVTSRNERTSPGSRWQRTRSQTQRRTNRCRRRFSPVRT